MFGSLGEKYCRNEIMVTALACKGGVGRVTGKHQGQFWPSVPECQPFKLWSNTYTRIVRTTKKKLDHHGGHAELAMSRNPQVSSWAPICSRESAETEWAKDSRSQSKSSKGMDSSGLLLSRVSTTRLTGCFLRSSGSKATPRKKGWTWK